MINPVFPDLAEEEAETGADEKEQRPASDPSASGMSSL